MLRLKYEYIDNELLVENNEIIISEEELSGLIGILTNRKIKGVTEAVSLEQEKEILNLNLYHEGEMESLNDYILSLNDELSVLQEERDSLLEEIVEI